MSQYKFKKDFQWFYKNHKKQTIKINQVSVSYYLSEAKETTLLVLPGVEGISESSVFYFKEFEEEYQILTLDYPLKIRENETLAKIIAELLTRLDIQKVCLIGHSYGGLLAGVIAKKYPGIVNAMIVSNSGTITKNVPKEEKEMWRKRLKNAYQKVNQTPLWILKPVLIKGMRKHITKDVKSQSEMEDLEHGIKQIYAQITKDNLLHSIYLMMDYLRNQRFQKEDFEFLAGKVLILQSPDDHVFSDAMQKELIKVCKDPLIRPLNLGGHYAPLLDFETLARECRSFFDHL